MPPSRVAGFPGTRKFVAGVADLDSDCESVVSFERGTPIHNNIVGILL